MINSQEGGQASKTSTVSPNQKINRADVGFNQVEENKVSSRESEENKH